MPGACLETEKSQDITQQEISLDQKTGLDNSINPWNASKPITGSSRLIKLEKCPHQCARCGTTLINQENTASRLVRSVSLPDLALELSSTTLGDSVRSDGMIKPGHGVKDTTTSNLWSTSEQALTVARVLPVYDWFLSEFERLEGKYAGIQRTLLELQREVEAGRGKE
ncbi:MAG: hypothetical protein Q9219_001618 [cf. Caloplaca sp. 3 TL-2023]